MSRTPQGFGDVLGEEVFTPQRMSIMAILSLVFGVLCLPGFGVLGVIFGAASLFAINSARGRLGGTGVAVAGLIVSIVACALWLALGIGMYQVAKVFEGKAIAPATTMAVAIEQGDYTQARTLLTPEANAQVTDEQFETFRQAYRAQLGSFKEMPKRSLDMIIAYFSVGRAFEGFKGQNDLMPLVAEFDQGMALYAFRMPFDTTKHGQPGAFQTTNVGIFTTDGKMFWLVDPAAPLPASPPKAPDAPPGEKPGG